MMGEGLRAGVFDEVTLPNCGEAWLPFDASSMARTTSASGVGCSMICHGCSYPL